MSPCFAEAEHVNGLIDSAIRFVLVICFTKSAYTLSIDHFLSQLEFAIGTRSQDPDGTTG